MIDDEDLRNAVRPENGVDPVRFKSIRLEQRLGSEPRIVERMRQAIGEQFAAARIVAVHHVKPPERCARSGHPRSDDPRRAGDSYEVFSVDRPPDIPAWPVAHRPSPSSDCVREPIAAPDPVKP
jgi:hypothetical protein